MPLDAGSAGQNSQVVAARYGQGGRCSALGRTDQEDGSGISRYRMPPIVA